ncbi:RadC family protein [Amphibiibacter pelophylacis]|uniref:DNA repair protein RadC n=1 Tax=Amphibiibacter pelophylacis TaxID=1799477 RepID=A0ACC6P5M2_9BURK
MQQLQLSFDNIDDDNTLYVRDSHGSYSLASPSQILAAARTAADSLARVGQEFSSPQAVKDFLIAKLAGIEHEIFGVIFVDSRHRLIDYKEMFSGTINAASVYPREVVKTALRLNASALIFTHNHPSGDASPSEADKRLTSQLQKALALIDINVLDHIIVAGTKTLSFAERGIL